MAISSNYKYGRVCKMRIEISDKGPKNGDPIVVLHGWGSTIITWLKIQDDLAALGYRVIIPDMPGFGKSEWPKEAWDSDRYAEWAAEFIRSQKLGEPVYLIGHSFGGALSIKLAVKHPELIKKLVLVAPSRIGPHKLPRKKQFLQKIAKLGRPLKKIPGSSLARRAFYRFIVKETDYLRTSGIMSQTMAAVIKEDLTPILHKVKCPALIVWGDKDKMTPVEGAYILNREIKNSELRIIPDRGHNLNIVVPHELANLIYQFIR